MALQLTINGVDYTKYIVQNITPVYDDQLNQSKTLTLSVYAADKNFTIVTKGQFLKLTYSNGTIFTGYLTQTPSLQVVSSGYAGYNLTAKSEESVFDVAAFGIQSPFVGQYAGDILKSLISISSPHNILNTSNVTQGPFVPYFAVQQSWTFTQAAYALAQKVGWRWWILDGVVNFAPQNDSPYGYTIDTTQPGFITQNFNFAASNSLVYNDVTALGPNEPQDFVEQAYWGNGVTSEYALFTAPYATQFTTPLFTDYFQSAILDPNIWIKKDPNGSFTYAPHSLTVNGSSPNFNTTLLAAVNTFELGGELLFDHGSVTFNAISVGLFGGLYSSNIYTSANCFAGFYFTGASSTTGITGYVNGQQVGSTVITQNNHSYRLQTYISADETYRFHDNYRSMAGQFGGDIVNCDAYVTLVVLDTDLSNPTATPTQTVIYDQRVLNIPAFAYYGYINSLGMFFGTKRGPIVTQLPNLRVRSTIQGRVSGTLNFVADTNSWSVSLPYVPSNTEGITIHYRQTGIAQSRLINNNSINLNGNKPATLAVQTLARTYADCENICQAFINDHSSTLYEGYYTQPTGVVSLIPQSGRYVSVNNPAIVPLFVSIVREVILAFTDLQNEKATIKTIFGFAPLFNQYFVSNTQGTITSTDFSKVPQYLPPNSTLHISAVNASQVTVAADKNPQAGFEVRSSDSGWGAGGFVLQSSAASFNVSRLSHNDTFYFREFDGGQIPKYSKFSSLLMGNGYPLAPPPPSSASSIAIGSDIIYTIVLQGDTTDVYGVEIRATDNVTVVYHALYTSNADLSFVVVNSNNITSLTGYHFYTFNSHGDYSAATIVNSTLSAGGGTPDPPSALTFVATDYIRAADGTIFAEVTVQWTPSDTPNAVYLIRYALHGTSNFAYMPVGASNIATITGLALNTSYDISVCAVGTTQSQSAFIGPIQVNTQSSTNAPTTPTGVSATGGFRVVGLKWNANSETDLAGYLIQFSTDNVTFSTITKVYTNLFVDTGDSARGVLNVSTTYYYKVAAFNTNGQASAFSASVSATTTQVGTTDIAANSITGNMIQANTITAAKISSVNASSVTGVLVPGNIPGIDASKLISGTLWGQNITTTTIDGSHITTGTVTANQLAAISRFSISKSIQFTGNSSGLTWTGGYIIVPDNTGANAIYTIGAQSSPIAAATGANGKYIYFSASISTTALQITGSVADGTLPSLPSDAFVVAVWHGLADITVFGGQTIIDGGHIQANTITAANIAAGTITASRIVISDASNLCQNPSGENGLGIDNWAGGIAGTQNADPNMLVETATWTTSPWFSNQLTSITNNTTDTTDPVGGNNAVKVVCNGGTDPNIGQLVSNVGSLLGQTFTPSVWIKGIGTIVGKSLGLYVYSSSINEVSVTHFIVSGSWQQISYSYTFATSTDTGVNFRVDPVDSGTFANTDTLYVWGPQLEPGNVLHDFIPNLGSTRVYTNNQCLIDSNRDSYYGNFFDCTAGDVFRFYVEACPSATNFPTADLTVGLHLRTSPSVSTGETWVQNLPGGYTSRNTPGWRTLKGQVTIPSGFLFTQIWVQINASPGATGTWYFRNLIVNRAASADLLVDGSITASKIVAGTITATQIAAGTITSAQIAAGTITTNNLTTGTLTIGGSAGMPTAINISDGGGTTVATIGTFTSALIGGGNIYGGWFKTLTAGGTKDAPNFVVDSAGNVFLLGGQIFNSHGIFSESFEYDITKYWNLRSGTTTGVTYPLNGVSGGRVLDTSNFIWEAFPVNIPFDPSKLYRMRARVRKTAGANRTQVFVGVEGVAADGVTLVNTTGTNTSSSQHYVCLNGLNVDVSSSWVTYTGYFKGNASGNAILNTSNAVDPDPGSTASQLHANVRYIRPLFILNYSTGGDTWDIDQITIDIIPDNLNSIADSQNWVKSGTQAQDNVVITGTCAGGGGNDFAYRQFSNVNYVAASGDTLEYDIFQDARNPQFTGGIDFEFGVSHTPFRGLGILDQNGILSHGDVSAWAKGRWYHRIFSLASVIGQTINTWAIALEGDAAGTYVTRIANVVVKNGNTIKAIIYSSGAVTNLGAWVVGGASPDSNYSNVNLYTADLSAGSASLDYHVADGSIFKKTHSAVAIQRYKVVSCGDSFSGGLNSFVAQNGTTIMTGARSYNVIVIDRTAMTIDSQTNYDVFGSSATATTMANALNALGSNKIVIIFSSDEPQTNRLTNGLQAAMERCGASKVYSSVNFKFRSAYILVGYPGLGLGNGLELYAGTIDSDPTARVETSVTIIDGEIQGLCSSIPFAYTIDELFDGGTFGRPLLARLSSGRPWIDFSESIHLNENLNFIGDTSSFAKIRTSITLGNTIAGRLATGRNLVANNSFEINNTTVAYGTQVQTGVIAEEWTVFENDNSNWGFIAEQTGFSHSGKSDLLIRLLTSQAISAGQVTNGIATNTPIPCIPGNSVYVNGWVRWDENHALPTGASVFASFGLFYFNTSGAFLSNTMGSGTVTANGGYVNLTATGVIPTGATTMAVVCQAQLLNNGIGNTAFNTSSSLYADIRFDDLSVTVKSDLDNEVLDGANYGRGILGFYGPNSPNPMASGFPINDNPDFINGLTRYSVYDNNATGHVSLSLVSDATAPNASGQKMRVTWTGAGENPNWGGFFLGFSADSGTVAPFTYHKGDTLVYKIIANIPAGFQINFNTNAFGNEGVFTWISSQLGTGAWQTYVGKQRIGITGTFSSTGFFSISGGGAPPSSIDVAHCSVVDIDQAHRYGVATIDASFKAIIDFNSGHSNKDTDHIFDGVGSPLAGGRRGFSAITASINLAVNVKIGGDSGIPCSGTTLTTADIFISGTGTTKVHIIASTGHEWSVASV